MMTTFKQQLRQVPQSAWYWLRPCLSVFNLHSIRLWRANIFPLCIRGGGGGGGGTKTNIRELAGPGRVVKNITCYPDSLK